MKKILFVLGLSVMLTAPARAGILNTILTFDGQDNVLEDNSREIINDTDGNGLISTGDVFYGLQRLDRRSQPNPSIDLGSTQQLVNLFSFEIASILRDSSGNVTGYIFKPTTATHAKSVKNLLDSALDPGTVANWNNVGVAMIEKTFATAAPGNNPVANTVTAGDTIIAGMTAAAGWSLDILAGFSTSTDFWDFKLDSSLSGNAAIPIAAIKALSSLSTVGTFAAGLSAVYNNFGGNAVFLPVTALSTIAGASVTTHDLAVIPIAAVSGYDFTNWDVKDVANIKLNVVPEPTTIALWAVGFVGMVGIARRRRRNNKKSA